MNNFGLWKGYAPNDAQRGGCHKWNWNERMLQVKWKMIINSKLAYNEQLRVVKEGMPQMIHKGKDAINEIKMKECQKWH